MRKITKQSDSTQSDPIIAISALAIMAVVFIAYYAMLIVSGTDITASKLAPGLIVAPIYLYWRHRFKDP